MGEEGGGWANRVPHLVSICPAQEQKTTRDSMPKKSQPAKKETVVGNGGEAVVADMTPRDRRRTYAERRRGSPAPPPGAPQFKARRVTLLFGGGGRELTL